MFDTLENCQILEKDYVRNTYDSIAEQFSDTRYKKWPKVENFVKNLPIGSLLLDVGCGNGKYLDNSSTINIGCDISSNLLTICKTKGFEVVHCDMMNLPFKKNQFDAIICIAALHHIVTEKRRQECLEKMIELLSDKQDSKLLIQVWSYEQELESNNPYLKRQQQSTTSCSSTIKDNQSKTMDSSKEICLRADKLAIHVHKNRTPFVEQDLLVPFKTKQPTSSSSKNNDLTEHLRYYHVFKKGELESLIDRIARAKLIESYYDRGNWCAIITKDNSSYIIKVKDFNTAKVKHKIMRYKLKRVQEPVER